MAWIFWWLSRGNFTIGLQLDTLPWLCSALMVMRSTSYQSSCTLFTLQSHYLPCPGNKKQATCSSNGWCHTLPSTNSTFFCCPIHFWWGSTPLATVNMRCICAMGTCDIIANTQLAAIFLVPFLCTEYNSLGLGTLTIFMRCYTVCRLNKKKVPEQLYTSGESSVFLLFVGGLSRRQGITNPYSIEFSCDTISYQLHSI